MFLSSAILDDGFELDILPPLHRRQDIRSSSTLSATPTIASIPSPAATTTESAAAKNLSMLLQPGQQVAISSVERTGAALSLLGVLLIIIAFCSFKRLRTVPNTFILCASIANVGASIACLIGYAGIQAGDTSSLCQAQAFLLEM
jgi:hypothetical protein